MATPSIQTTQAPGGSLSYIGNPDFRGYLSALAANGDTMASDALAFVGNDGKLNPSYQTTYHFDTPGQATPQDLANYVSQKAQSFNTIGTAPLPGPNANTTSPTAPAAPSVIPGVNDPATLAGYDQAIGQLNDTIGRLPTQEQGTDAQIKDAYNTAYQTLLGNKNQATSTYNTNTNQNRGNYVTNKNTIATNAGQSLTGLERLLGSRGAGGSSTALFSAPQAVATQASQQRSGAGQTFGDNQQNLDTSYNTFLTGNGNDVNSIARQRDANLNSTAGTIANTRGGLLQQLATLSAQKAAATGGNPTNAAAPYLAQANSALDAATHLGLNIQPLNYNTSAYSAPGIASYTTNPFATPVSNGQGGGNINSTTINPAFNTLLKPKLSGVTTAAAPTGG